MIRKTTKILINSLLSLNLLLPSTFSPVYLLSSPNQFSPLPLSPLSLLSPLSSLLPPLSSLLSPLFTLLSNTSYNYPLPTYSFPSRLSLFLSPLPSYHCFLSSLRNICSLLSSHSPSLTRCGTKNCKTFKIHFRIFSSLIQ